jgi:hypothetical protein
MRRARRNRDAMLAALADGSIPDAERERLLADVESSPGLAAELESQRQALAALKPLRAASAPSELHGNVSSLVANAPAPRPARSAARRLVPVGALLAAGALIVALVLASSGSSTPTVRQAALLALRPATLPSPAESRQRRGVLVRSVDGIPFPYWKHVLGWRTSGARTDQIAGRTATTVFYTPTAPAGGPARVGYTILAGDALPLPNAPIITRRGVHFRVLTDEGATVLTWRRSGHTCILAARGVPAATLAHLASWT